MYFYFYTLLTNQGTGPASAPYLIIISILALAVDHFGKLNKAVDPVTSDPELEKKLTNLESKVGNLTLMHSLSGERQ